MKKKSVGASSGRKENDLLFQLVNGAIFTLFALVCAYPFYYVIINSMSDSVQVDLGRVLLYPIGFTMENYRKVLEIDGLAWSAFISLARTVLGTSLSLIGTYYMAYLFSREHLWKRKLWYRMVVATMYFSAGLIPGYLLNKYLGLMNNFLLYIIPGVFSVYNMILVKTYIESIPHELEESAAIDGAGVFTKMFRIIMPLSTPILATIALFTSIGHWNSYMDTLLYMTNSRLYTLQFRLQMMYRQIQNLTDSLKAGDTLDQKALSSIAPSTVRYAITVVVVAPVMCVYPFVQNYFVKGIMIGAVKG